MDSKNNSTFEMVKLGLVLAVYASVFCTILALVNNVTSPVIANNQTEKVNKAMQAFFPEEGYSFVAVDDYEPKMPAQLKLTV